MKTELKLLRLSILGIAILFSAARIEAQDIQVVTTTKNELGNGDFNCQ
jgi:hypothetical protein